MKQKWNATHIPDMTGKTIIITGATSGLGKEATRVLAGKNATVIMAIRNLSKGESVKNEILKEFSQAKISLIRLDLTSLESIHLFVNEFKQKYNQLNILINNAGIMACPYATTDDGFEIQMGTNHLGPFALTGLLMPMLRETPNSRIVSTSSLTHKFGKIDLSDINWNDRDYKTSQAYSDSKIANLYFMFELARKYQSDSKAPTITAAHPGWTETELQRHTGFISLFNKVFAQDVEHGTLPTLRAAIDENATSGDYFGPKRFFELWGDPVLVKPNELSQNKEISQQLWKISEDLTGVTY